MKHLRIINASGDKVLTWENGKETEVIAEQIFEELKSTGHSFHKYSLGNEDPEDIVMQANGIINDFKDIPDNEYVMALSRHAGG